MKYRRGAIVEACFLMPDNNKTLNHPAIVLSNEDMYNVAIVGGIYPGLVTQSLVKECDSNALEWLRSQNMNKKLELLLL